MQLIAGIIFFWGADYSSLNWKKDYNLKGLVTSVVRLFLCGNADELRFLSRKFNR